MIVKNERKFNKLTLDDILPKKIDSITETVTPIADCSAIYGAETPAGIGLTTVLSIDLNTPTAPGSQIAVFGAKGIVYASLQSLYLTTSRHYVLDAFESGLWLEETSGIHKFDLTAVPSSATYRATGAVPGRMLNQFCLGEKDGYLRLATTTGSRWDENELNNHVLVLAEQGASLTTVGQLDGLGLGEEIYAARFLGDRGFLVTFLQTDPLFTLDMSDPHNPRAVGEWQGPGYSTYLHPIGANHLLSVGLEDWQVAISLYDVTDFATPTLLTRLKFPDQSMVSAATSDHRALTFNEETGFLAVPFYKYENNDTGLFTYAVLETGITQAAALHMNSVNDLYEGSASRSVYIGDYLYGLSRCRITSSLLASPDEMIDTLPLFTIGSCDDYSEMYYDEVW